jgi:hypothetical protein
MIITKAKLAEEIQRLYVRYLHRDDLSPTTDPRELMLHIEHIANEELHVQSVAGFSNGNIDIPTGSLATYTTPLVGVGGTYSTTELPVYPIRLPFDIGVWKIYDPADPFNPFIPLIQMDQVLVSGNPAELLEQQVGFYVEGKLVRFTKDLTVAPYNLTDVNIVLLLNDLSQYSDSDVLPITPEIAGNVITGVLKLMGMGQVALQEMNKAEEQEKQLTNVENRDS